MPPFPRDIVPARVSGFLNSGALMSSSDTGKMHTRATMHRSRVWREWYPPFRASSPEGRKFMTTVNYFWRGGIEFDIEHYLYLTPNGAGGGAPLVNGANQTGDTLNVDGLAGVGAPWLRAGDLFSIANVKPRFEVREDAIAAGGAVALKIFPPIFAGGSPADNAALTVTGVRLFAKLVEPPNFPDVPATQDAYVDGVVLTFREQI